MRKKILIASLVGGMLATPTALNHLGKAVGSPALAQLPSVADLMMMRSPGPRPKGALVNTKSRKIVTRVKTPHISFPARPLLPVVPISQITRLDMAGSMTPFEVPVTFGAFSSTTPPLVIGGSGGSSGGGSTIPGGIGGDGTGGTRGGGFPGGGIPGGGIPTPVITPTPITPVPEPATWAMLLVGFGLVGLTLRRTRMQSLQL